MSRKFRLTQLGKDCAIALPFIRTEEETFDRSITPTALNQYLKHSSQKGQADDILEKLKEAGLVEELE